MEQVTINLENLGEDDKKRFWDIVEKANKSQIWEPKDGDKYYIVRSDAVIDSAIWYGWACDKYRYRIGNCFKTKEEAEFAAERLKVISEIEQFAKKNNPLDFKNDHLTMKWIIVIRNSSGEIEPIWATSAYPCVTFATEKIAKAAIEKIGRDRLKKYYFGVTE